MSSTRFKRKSQGREMKSTNHVVIDKEGFLCERCGGKFELKEEVFPISIDDFESIGTSFISRHINCKLG